MQQETPYSDKKQQSTIRRIAIREAGVSRYTGDPIKGPP